MDYTHARSSRAALSACRADRGFRKVRALMKTCNLSLATVVLGALAVSYSACSAQGQDNSYPGGPVSHAGNSNGSGGQPVSSGGSPTIPSGTAGSVTHPAGGSASHAGGSFNTGVGGSTTSGGRPGTAAGRLDHRRRVAAPPPRAAARSTTGAGHRAADRRLGGWRRFDIRSRIAGWLLVHVQ